MLANRSLMIVGAVAVVACLLGAQPALAALRLTTPLGDVNGDGDVNVQDVFYLINHLFAGGPASIGAADVNADGQVNVQDVFYLINYLFAGGPAPMGDEITAYLGPNNTVPLVLVRIPAGTLTMGAPTGERGSSSDEKPQHEVTLSQAYYLGKTEVTQAQWAVVMGAPMPTECGSHGVGDSYPVYCVSWNDICGGTTGASCAAGSFIGKVNTLLGSTRFRLPTEAEWEWAARGGTTTEFSFAVPSNWDIGCGSFLAAATHMWWCGHNTPSGSKPVGTKQVNPYGLHDMHGNLYEWVGDWYGSYGSGAVTDPPGPATGSYRVNRGGCWNSLAQFCRSAYRRGYDPGYLYGSIGFRLARSL